MGQLLAILIIPPLVGIITYALFRFIWEKESRQIVWHRVGTSMQGKSRRLLKL